MEISLKRLPGVLAKEFEQTRIHIAKGLRDGCRIGKTVLKRKTKKDRGMAQMGWQNHNGPINARGDMPAAWLENSTPYIGILENGARPHPVSVQGQRAIYEWVERHFRLAGGIVLSGRSMGAGIRSDSLTNTKSRAHKVARQDYLDKLTRLGAMLEDTLVRNFPEMGRRMVPAALNIAAAIIHKIRTKGQAPTFFVKGAQQELALIAQEQVEKHIREGAKGRAS